MTLAALFPVMVPTAAFAAPVLTLEPITWNVVGLDSNSVASGPNVFPVGVRVCNTGDATATNVQADFVWDTANGLINLSGATSVTNPQLPAGSCADFNFDVVVTRSAAAYDTVRRYHINVTADGLGTLSTPQPREIYVEHLVSQNRNDIDSISGPSTVEVGGTYTFTLVAKTATNGYEQIENFLTFPNLIFRVDAVSTTYSAPVGGTNDAVYADACGWDNDPGSATYRQCIGPEQFPGAKAGGDLTTVFTVTILSSGSATLTSLIYDFSGSSFHYNSDFGLDVLAVTAVPSADLSITKADAADPVLAGDDLVYTLSVNNAGPSDASNLTVTDNLPPGTSFVSASGLGWTCNESSGVVTCTRASLAAGASAPDITLTVTAPSAGGNITNSASVASSTADPSAPNNSAAEQTTVTPSVDLALGIDDSPDPVDAGSNVDYTVTVTNNGPSDATNLTVTNTVPVGTTFVSSSGNGWSCSESSGTVTCTRPALARFASAPDITITVTAPPSAGTITDSASVSATESDPDPGNDSDSEDTAVQDPPPPPPNNPPVATDDVANTTTDTPVPIGVTANDTDADGNLDPSTVQVTVDPPNGSVTCDTSGVCTYTPDPGFSGPDSFDYQVCDTDGACDTATVNVTVDAPPPPPPNNPPVATDDVANTTSDTPVAIGVTANDSDPDGNLDPSTVQVTVDPPNGSVTCDGTGVCT
ncbi:MAG: Ig-like domain-containing protein, partial [Actinomycetota bacterium]